MHDSIAGKQPDCHDWQVLPGSHKSSFPRPHGLFGTYGFGARKAFRENGNVNIKASEMPLPESYKKLGMKPICPNAGDMMVMPEVRSPPNDYLIAPLHGY